MKHIFLTRISAPLVLGALLMGGVPSWAQPGAPATPQMAPNGKGNGKRGGNGNGKMGAQRRVFQALEAKTGKPISPEVHERILQSARVRDAATQAAQEKYLVDFAAATGLTLDEARELNKTARRNPNAANGQGAGAGGEANKEARKAERKRLRQMNKNGGAPEAPVAAPVAQ